MVPLRSDLALCAFDDTIITVWMCLARITVTLATQMLGFSNKFCYKQECSGGCVEARYYNDRLARDFGSAIKRGKLNA